MRSFLLLLVVMGVLGFILQLALPSLGLRLGSVALPGFFETVAIRLPDGGTLTATTPLQRLQRFDAAGHFRTGWFVAAHGGSFAVGLGAHDEVVVCSARRREATVYDVDGAAVGSPRPCVYALPRLPAVAQPGDLQIAGLELRHVEVVRPPPAGFTQWLLVPFWHPGSAWLMALLGSLGLRWLPRD